MTQIYEAFLRWLSLWLPDNCTMYEHLDYATYGTLDYEFWKAIAPENATQPHGV